MSTKRIRIRNGSESLLHTDHHAHIQRDASMVIGGRHLEGYCDDAVLVACITLCSVETSTLRPRMKIWNARIQLFDICTHRVH